MSHLIFNTLILASGAVAISLPLGALLGWLVARTDVPGRRSALGFLPVLLFVPLYLQAAAWEAGFGLQGAITLGIRWNFYLAGMPGAIWIHAMAAVPWVAIVTVVALQHLPADWEELALLDGPPLAVFLRLTLPAIAPALGLAALFGALVAASEIVVTDLCLVRTYAEEVYTQFALVGDPTAVLSVGPGIAVTGTLVLLGGWLVLAAAPRHWELGERPARPLALRRLRWPAAALMAALVLVVAAAPLGSLFYKAGVVVQQAEQGRVRSWSAVKCLAMVAAAPWNFRRELYWTTLIGLPAAVAAVACAVPLAWVARRGGRRAIPLALVTALGLAIPGPVLGVSIIWLMDTSDMPLLNALYSRTVAAPLIAQFVRALPVAAIALWHAMATVPRELEDLAALDGLGPAGRLWRMALPLRFRAVAAALVLAFAVAAGEVSASILVLPPGVNTLANRVFSLMHYGIEDQLAAVSLVSLAGLAALIAAGLRLLNTNPR